MSWHTPSGYESMYATFELVERLNDWLTNDNISYTYNI